MHYNRLLYKLRRAIYKPMIKLVILDLFFFLVSIGAFFVTKGYAVEFFVFRYSIPLAFVTTVWLLVGYTFKKYRGLLYKLRRVIYKPMLKLVILDLFFFLVSIGAFFVTKGYAVEFFVFRYSIPLAFVTTVWIS